MVATDRVILSGGDPGAPIGQGSQAVFSRLGYVGLDTGIGSFAWGKQWSAYYDVAVFTDQFPLWSGAAAGAFAAGTDGGVSGTGRSEQALQYREARGPVSVALQMQSRASSPNDRSWVDVWGASGVVGKAQGLSLGAAYNEVRDGVASPNPNQPQLGDKAAIFGLRYRADRFYAATTLAISEQHEVDDLGRRFDATGFELALRYHATDALGSRPGTTTCGPTRTTRASSGPASASATWCTTSGPAAGSSAASSSRTAATPTARSASTAPSPPASTTRSRAFSTRRSSVLDAIVPFLKELVLIPLTLLPIINPFSSAPVLIANAGRDRELVRRLARQVSLNSFYVIIASMLVGTNVLAIFGISLPILRVGGGLLVCATAWRMLSRAEGDDVQEKAVRAASEMPEAEVVRRSFFPLTFPLTTGPGTIAVAIALGAQFPRSVVPYLLAAVVAVAGVAVTAFVLYVFFSNAGLVLTWLGEMGALVMMRLIAFILLCVGLQIMWTGWAELNMILPE